MACGGGVDVLGTEMVGGGGGDFRCCCTSVLGGGGFGLVAKVNPGGHYYDMQGNIVLPP